jgi:serine phosphatase RsbU (regulator of sigma subunit)
VLVVGTDGVWEMFNEKEEQYGKERLRRVMRAHHARPAADVTFVVVKFRPCESCEPAG